MDQEKQQSTNQQKQKIFGDFILPGQIQQIDRTNYDSSAYLPTSKGLLSLYAGFPNLNKHNIATISKFSIQYFPNKNDLVIGVIKIRTAQSYVVDICAPMDAVLGSLDFDGATKRNKPNLQVGCTVFCRVVEYSKYTGGKLSCLNKGFNTKTSNEMGELKGGQIIWIPSYRHHIVQSRILERIGKCVKFEIAFSHNGYIWIKTGRAQNSMIISNMIQVSIRDGDNENILEKMLAMIK